MEAPEKNISHVIFGSYEIKAWYNSPYVLDGLVRPDPPSTGPLRLNGGFSGDTHMDAEDDDMTDSTDVDDSMQRLPEVSVASVPASPVSGPSSDHTLRAGSVAGPSTARPSALRKLAKASDSNGRHRSPASRPLDESEISHSSTIKSRKDKAVHSPVKLYVCEGCFKYMVHPASYAIHSRSCKMRHPPGRKVYQKGAHTIWEVDGETQKLYCQNLCLFGKLFIDHKYVFFETSGFLFYVLSEARPSFDHTFGFFSKEKVSYNDYNLACIVTFPPYQKRGYGTLMIEFSYELSTRSLYSRRAGTPERPLSDLGLRGYLQFWTSVLVRYFRLIFYTRNDPRLALSVQPTAKMKPKNRKKVRGFQGEIVPEAADSLAVTVADQSKVEMMSASPDPAQEGDTIAGFGIGSYKARASQEAEEATADLDPSKNTENPVLPDAGQPHTFEMQFSLAEIAHATDLREDDVAFALVHSGLASFRSPAGQPRVSTGDILNQALEHDPLPTQDMQIVITAAIVEDIANKFKVKRQPVLSKLHCLF